MNIKKYNLIFLPGWKNKKESLNSLKVVLNKYFSIHSYDYPYVKEDNSSMNMDDYVNYLHSLIKDKDNIILLGHSFGGKIASFYAKKYDIKGLVLIAPSTYLTKSFKVKIKIFLTKIFNLFSIKKPSFLLGSKDYISLNEKEKETFKNVLKYLSKQEMNMIKAKTIIIGFNKDKSVKVKDLKVLSKNIKGSLFKIYEGDHFGYLNHINEISYLIGDSFDVF